MPKELPDMNSDVMKQLLFDCAMHLLYEQDTYTREDVAENILYIINKHDEYEKETRRKELNSRINELKKGE